jgi:hypothetical protein
MFNFGKDLDLFILLSQFKFKFDSLLIELEFNPVSLLKIKLSFEKELLSIMKLYFLFLIRGSMLIFLFLFLFLFKVIFILELLLISPLVIYKLFLNDLDSFIKIVL